MKKAFLNWRYYLMMVIGFVVFIGIFGVPEDSLPLGSWMLSMLISKIIGFGGAYLMYRLFTRWDARNLVPELSKMMQEDV